MSYAIKQYRPRLSVVAWHGKTRYDLTPYVMQGTTHKALGETEGQWAVLLTFEKRWDKILSNMDYVEIKMSRFNPEPIIIMRGFISNRRRTRVMDQGGNWHRAITINGNDYGKLIAQYEIYYMANIPGQQLTGTDVDPAQGLLAPLLSENLGAYKGNVDGTIPLKDFIPKLAKHTLTPWIQALQKTTPSIPDLVVSVNVLDDYVINWLTLQSMQGGLDGVFQEFVNAPWCEFMVIDAPDAPKIIHRNAPFKDNAGKFVFHESALDPRYWGDTVIYDWMVAEEDIGSTDSETYDYFFTYPSLFTAGDLPYKYAAIATGEFGNGNDQQKYQQESNLGVPTNPKVIADYIYRYGLKIMEVASPAIPVLDTGEADPMSVQLSIKMNMWLARVYQWAPDMLNGTIRMMGNEYVGIGKYIFNADQKEEYYTESVDHTFTQTQAGSRGNDQVFDFSTSVGVTRGRSAPSVSYGSEPTMLVPIKSTTIGGGRNIHPI